MKPTNVTGYPFSNGDRLTAVSVNQICNALDAIQDYNDTIKEFEDLVEENAEEIKTEINKAMISPESVVAISGELTTAKKTIVDALNNKGATTTTTESFQELAQDITNLPLSEAELGGIETVGQFNVLKWIANNSYRANTADQYVKSINDDTLTEIDRNYSLQSINSLTSVVLSGVQRISAAYAFNGCTSLNVVRMVSLITITGERVFSYCSLLKIVELPNLMTVSGISVFEGCASLQSISLPNLITLSNGSFFKNCTSLTTVDLPKLATITSEQFYGCVSLTSISLPELVIMSGAGNFTSCSFLQTVDMPKLATSSSSNFYGCTALESVTFGSLVTLAEPFSNAKPKLRNITIGANTDINLQFQHWAATNVIAEGQSGIDELNENLYDNLLTKLYDHSGDGQTRTLRIGWLSNVSAENIAYASAKGWTLTT